MHSAKISFLLCKGSGGTFTPHRAKQFLKMTACLENVQTEPQQELFRFYDSEPPVS